MRSTRCSSRRGARRRLAWGLALPAALIALMTGVSAHDFWVEASAYRPATGERVAFDLKVGEHFLGDSLTRNLARFVRFTVRGPDGQDEDVVGIDGRAPAGLWRPRSGGVHLLGYRSAPSSIELEAARFEAYLAEEGLQHVIELRRDRGQSGESGREIYSRSAKALLVCRDPERANVSAKGFDARIGLRLEIVPETDPSRAKPGDELPVRVWFDDKPLAGALVGCMAKADPAEEVRLRTDAEGRARFRLAHDGLHLVRVCWMTPAPADSGADWESTWGSLTFEVPRAPVVPADTPQPAPGK